MTEKHIRVGTAVFLINDKKQYVMGKRKGSHGEGTWSLVGGYIEFGETFEQAATREVMEETGLTFTDFKPIAFAEHFFNDVGKHNIVIYCMARIGNQIPKTMEPHKIEGWQFFDDWSKRPGPNFVDYDNEIDPKLIEDYISKI